MNERESVSSEKSVVSVGDFIMASEVDFIMVSVGDFILASVVGCLS